MFDTNARRRPGTFGRFDTDYGRGARAVLRVVKRREQRAALRDANEHLLSVDLWDGCGNPDCEWCEREDNCFWCRSTCCTGDDCGLKRLRPQYEPPKLGALL